MRAVFYERNGAARDVLRLADLQDPHPGPGEVRVRLAWSGVNPSDVKSRAGLRNRSMDFPLVIPHSDGMGVIDAVGHGVDVQRIGQRVWVWSAAWGRPFGTAAQYVCLLEKMAVPLPDEVPGEVGACLGIPAMTAMHAVLMDGGVAGKRVLITGGAGAVGHYAIQFAHRMGAAQVLTTVSNAEKAALALAAGADHAINYTQEDVVSAVSECTGGRGLDRIIEVDLASNAVHDIEMLGLGGEIVAYGSKPSPIQLPFPALLTKNLQLKFFMIYHIGETERNRAQAALTRMLVKGDLQHNIAQRLPLERVVDAHEAVESGQLVGNLVLSI